MSENNEDRDSTQKIPRMTIPESKLIPVVCSWCKKIYKLSSWQISQDRRTGVSHGICPACLAKFEEEQKNKK